ncbi:cyclic nucleotide-binding domain-containing protein [Methylobacterium brachythecii]|uniref:Cyclic nucleotide-binding domain-containing protein n=1 Tax=Methylobacterium brachythecii TaxID=1176177 RepID=A0A7W6F901_9HYPH|nr:cyclic nucleotide-binding domain-containing protein [Methylobacterium brachythecii]MBB3904998.1 hypothetical protein [Methylobacterium brachythecii]GLS45782.1 hypothetical protein GCM10007884_37730 [Methylobacterium brachythecii]
MDHHETGETRHLARLALPETFGEMALLSMEPRSATAFALRDSHLLRLSRLAFEELIEEHPQTLLYSARLLTLRLKATSERRSIDHAPRGFAILAVTEGLDAKVFGERFARTFDSAIGGTTGCLTDWPAGADEFWFHEYEARNERTGFVADRGADCPWCQLCLRHADHILLLAQPGRCDRALGRWSSVTVPTGFESIWQFARRPGPNYPKCFIPRWRHSRLR